jgi:hypothetical protein
MSVDARPARPSFPESCEVHSESWEECEYHRFREPTGPSRFLWDGEPGVVDPRVVPYDERAFSSKDGP